MSGYDRNPFADPELDNPFQDSSVTQARQTTAATAALDEYNPFTDAKTTTTMAAKPVVPTQPAIMKLTEEPPAPSQPRTQGAPEAPSQAGGAGELLRRQEELERKAAELDRREREMQSLSASGGRRKNWPPLPDKFPVGPCFYQDINVDIPVEYQKTVKIMYYLWMFHTGVLLANLVGCLAWFCIDSSRGIDFGMAILWFLIFTPCSFVCWYRPVYGAFRSDSSFSFFIFFFVYVCQRLDLRPVRPQPQCGGRRPDDPHRRPLHLAGGHVAHHVQKGPRHVPHHRSQLPKGPAGVCHGGDVQQDGADGRRQRHLKGSPGGLQGADLSPSSFLLTLQPQ
uniref:secretory carrier-associated membrane protein 1-like isoform X2 n=1 Tax=Doryrhamphus excisus TaxID=161450 RepID=UPI0025AE5E24|nr:secretory carrier-associated membrane protein 1-like isoform X2 [Doryrhamphus excisus]